MTFFVVPTFFRSDFDAHSEYKVHFLIFSKFRWLFLFFYNVCHRDLQWSKMGQIW